MTRSIKTAASLVALTGLATPAFAHVGDHSVATSTHWLVEHGLAMGIAATVVIAAVAFYLRKKA